MAEPQERHTDRRSCSILCSMKAIWFGDKSSLTSSGSDSIFSCLFIYNIIIYKMAIMIMNIKIMR
jgi:hypothetical protein